MRRSHRVFAATTALALVGGVSACGGSSGDDTATPATAQASAKEVAAVSSVRPTIDTLVAALQKKDLAASQTAYADYDATWNGIEVYVNVRDVKLYTTLEHDLQDPIGEALEKPSPDFDALVPTAQKLGTSFDQAIANSKAGPPLSPLFDDVTALRVVRADLRRTSSDIDAGDIDAAEQHFSTFAAAYPTVRPLVTARSGTADGQITAAITAARQKFADGAGEVEMDPLVSTVTARYNYAVSLLNVAARNADLGRSAVASSDVDGVRTLRQVEASLETSEKAWKAGDYAAAKAAATQAQGSFDKVAPALEDKKAVPDVDEAIDTYAGEAGAAGDATKVPEDAAAAIEAAQVAEQALVGQFWTDAAVRQQLAAG
jgi:hypothetical protein